MTIPTSTVTGGHGTDGEIVDNQAAINALLAQFGGAYAKGDLIYGSAANTLSKRAIGSTSDALRVISGLPQWTGDFLNAVAFGAVANGSTDNTAAIQAAHDALSGNGGTIYFPKAASTYKITGTVAFTKPIRLLGDNWDASVILGTTASHTWFTTTAQIVAEHMGFTATGAGADSAIFIKQDAMSANHNGSFFRQCYFQGANKAYWGVRSTEFRVDGCKFGAGSYGLYLENNTSSDEGDSFVTNSTFANTAAGIYIASTSGLYITNNKFNSACTAHIDIANTTNAVGDYTITGNSLEGHTTAGVRAIGTSGADTKLLITGNQFSSSSATHVIIGAKTQNVTITGNTFNDTNSANGLGVDVQTGALNVTITGNAFHQILQAIQASSTVLGINASGNRFASDVTTYWTGEDSISGLSAFGSAKTFAASRLSSNTSSVTYQDMFKVKGDCIVDLEISGVVQGVGNTYKYRKFIVSTGTTITDAIALITVGTGFDLQVAAAGGYVVVSVKLNAGVGGTNLTVMVTVRVSGYPTGFLHA